MNKGNFIVIGCLLALLGMYFSFQHDSLAYETKAAQSKATPATSPRPRVVYFFAPWCGVCQRYGPLLKTTVYAYRNYIDFQQINVDSPSNRALAARFHIRGIPVTYIYNSKGQAVFAKTGYVDQQSIYNALKSVYMEGAIKPTKIQTDKHNQK